MIADAATLEYTFPPEIVAPVGQARSPRPKWTFTIPHATDATTTANAGFQAHFAKLRAIATDHALWVDDASPPSPVAIQWAQFALQELQVQALEPSRVVASAEGGAAICLVHGKKYADIECLNSGAILGVISDKSNWPAVWEIEPDARGIARAVARIREFLDAPTSRSVDSRKPRPRSALSFLAQAVLSMRARGR
jgi:hypothetical protein